MLAVEPADLPALGRDDLAERLGGVAQRAGVGCGEADGEVDRSGPVRLPRSGGEPHRGGGGRQGEHPRHQPAGRLDPRVGPPGQPEGGLGEPARPQTGPALLGRAGAVVVGQLEQHPQRRGLTERPGRHAGQPPYQLAHQAAERTAQFLLRPALGPQHPDGEQRPAVPEQAALGELTVGVGGGAGTGAYRGGGRAIEQQLNQHRRVLGAGRRAAEWTARAVRRRPRPTDRPGRPAPGSRCSRDRPRGRHSGRRPSRSAPRATPGRRTPAASSRPRRRRPRGAGDRSASARRPTRRPTARSGAAR